MLNIQSKNVLLLLKCVCLYDALSPPPTNIKMKFLQAGIKDKGVFLLFINNTSQITKLNINHSVTRKKKSHYQEKKKMNTVKQIID